MADVFAGEATVDHSRIGPLFVGVFLAGCLWGVSCSQVFHYITTRAKDHIFVKLMIAVIWGADTAHQWLLFVTLYGYVVVNYGNPVSLDEFRPGNATAQFTLMNGITLIVQGLYIYRIWILSTESILVIGLPCLIWLTEFALALVNAYNASSGEPTMHAFLARQQKVMPAYFAVTSSLDILMSVLLLVLLIQKHNESELPRTQSILKKLALFMVSTNLLTAMFTMAVAIVYIQFPTKFYMIPFFHLVTPLYTTSFFGVLNMRPYLKAEFDAAGSDVGEVSTTAVRFQLSNVRSRNNGASWTNGDTSWINADMDSDNRWARSGGQITTGGTSIITEVKMYSDSYARRTA